MPLRTSYALAGALLAAAPLAAQEGGAGPLVPGARVRLAAPVVSRDRIVGRLVRADGDTIVLRGSYGGDTVRVPAAAVRRLEVTRGRRPGPGTRRGAVIGAVAIGGTGLALTTFVVFGERSQQKEQGYCGDDGCYFATKVLGVLSAVGAGLGAVSGALVGALVGAEGWQRVPVPPRVGIAPLPDGRGLAVRLAF